MFIKTPPKGTRDILPQDFRLRENVMTNIKKTYAAYGFFQIETPEIEDLSLLMSKQGGENEKLVYKILKRGDKLQESMQENSELCDLGLRYELTLSLARFFANNSGKLPPTFRAIQVGNVFRADRPQRGRFRQFVQCDIDIIGDGSNFAEVELILATAEALKSVGLGGLTIKINDRRLLACLAAAAGIDESCNEAAFIALDKLDKCAREDIAAEVAAACGQDCAQKLFEIFDRINSSAQPLQACKEIFGEKGREAAQNLTAIMSAVSAASCHANLVFDLSLVRGMSYYTGTIFEVFAQSVPFAIGGGGRYDKLLAKILGGKENIPACGFSIGFERICTLLAERGQSAPAAPSAALLVPDGENLSDACAAAAKMRQNINCGIYKRAKNAYFQIKSLKELGVSDFYIYKNGEFEKIND